MLASHSGNALKDDSGQAKFIHKNRQSVPFFPDYVDHKIPEEESSVASNWKQLERGQSAILDNGDKCDDGINGWHDKSGFSLRTRYTM